MTVSPPETARPPDHPAADTDAMLHRILAAVEKQRRRGGLEFAVAIILSLTSLASTWCGYQASSWGGSQNSKQSAADTAERQAAEDTIVGLQMRTFDAIALTTYWQALRENDTETQTAILARVRPQLVAAIQASMAANVLHDRNAPGPLQRPEYVLAEEQNAKAKRAEAAQLKADALKAGRASADYVLLTLMFASVLFFGGITGTLTARRARLFLTTVAMLIFVVALVRLAGLPITHR